jgi:hypothetical protein
MIKEYIEKTKSGRICLGTLSLEIFIGEIFEVCDNEEQIEFVKENLIDIIECVADERLEELEEEC